MAYTSFKSIPAELVASNEATLDYITKHIKNNRNMHICHACLKEARERASDPKSYGAMAWRRVAILVAGWQEDMLTAQAPSWCEWKQKYNMPDPTHKTTRFLIDYINETKLKRRIGGDFFECFPPHWRYGGMKDDDPRILAALEVLEWYTDKLRIDRENYNYIHTPGPKNEAYYYYKSWYGPDMNIIKDCIKRHLQLKANTPAVAPPPVAPCATVRC
jgi:hypothetical protein